MRRPIPAAEVASSPRIPLHSAIGKPLLYTFTGMWLLGVCGLSVSAFRREPGMHPLVVLASALLAGLMAWRLWVLCQRVYVTSDGIELTRPPRVVPWQKVGDIFRVPRFGSLWPTCCIGINDAENWDLRFFARRDFEQVIARFRPPHHPARSQ
jgi:hypothetical protein